MPPSIQLFIVFHKCIFDDCYKNIPDDILQKYFTFVAVNPKIEKFYTKGKYKIVNEWELPIYDPTFQERGYNENSVIYHTFVNNIYKEYDYIGFFQYDMKFNTNIIDFLQMHINTEILKYFPHDTHTFRYCTDSTWNEPETLQFIIKNYEAYFGKPFSKTKQYPLWNTYILPSQTYGKLMNWIVQLYEKLYPWCIQPPNATHFGHIGGIYERIMGFAIGEEDLSAIPLDIAHDHKYKQICY